MKDDVHSVVEGRVMWSRDFAGFELAFTGMVLEVVKYICVRI